jgi:hypothetical protein
MSSRFSEKLKNAVNETKMKESFVDKKLNVSDTAKKINKSMVSDLRKGVGDAARHYRASSPTAQSKSLALQKENWLSSQNKNGGGTKRKRKGEHGEPANKKIRRIGSPPKNNSTKKHVTYDPSIKDTEFRKEKLKKLGKKRLTNILNRTYGYPRSADVIFHDYPKNGPNSTLKITHLRNRKEFNDMKDQGLTFGGRKRKSKRNCKSK